MVLLININMVFPETAQLNNKVSLESTLQKKSSFPLGISSVNVTKKSLRRNTEEILNGKLHF